MSIVLVDCYDSFTFNIVQALGALGEPIRVVRCDEIIAEDLTREPVDGLILGPGPGRPEQAGCLIPLVRTFANACPILGICLGHQAIGVAFGGTLSRHKPVHGHATTVLHDQTGLFTGVRPGISMTRYHSLIVEEKSLPTTLVVNARSEDGAIMGIRHGQLPIHGVQFHPESVLSGQPGLTILENFSHIVRLARASARVEQPGTAVGWPQ